MGNNNGRHNDSYRHTYMYNTSRSERGRGGEIYYANGSGIIRPDTVPTTQRARSMIVDEPYYNTTHRQTHNKPNTADQTLFRVYPSTPRNKQGVGKRYYVLEEVPSAATMPTKHRVEHWLRKQYHPRQFEAIPETMDVPDSRHIVNDTPSPMPVNHYTRHPQNGPIDEPDGHSLLLRWSPKFEKHLQEKDAERARTGTLDRTVTAPSRNSYVVMSGVPRSRRAAQSEYGGMSAYSTAGTITLGSL